MRERNRESKIDTESIQGEEETEEREWRKKEARR